MTSDALRVLLAGLVDYAGLFPPAALPMGDVVRNYDAYRASDDAWMLGRLVVPVSRLDELAACLADHSPDQRGARSPWRVSALGGDDARSDGVAVSAWNERHRDIAIVDAIELRASSPGAIAKAADALHEVVPAVFAELPLDADLAPLLDEARRTNVRAKIRTGGTTPGAFPAARAVAHFLVACAERRVPFKATAGLHHPVRSEYRLTYDEGAASHTMYGFLNVFLAGMFARKGMPEPELCSLLEERDPASFAFTGGAVRWRDEELDLQRIADYRTSAAISFGSCSFREPVDDLRTLGIL